MKARCVSCFPRIESFVTFASSGSCTKQTRCASASSCTRVKLASQQVRDGDEPQHRTDPKLEKHARGRPTTIRFVASPEGHRLRFHLHLTAHERSLGGNEVPSPRWHRDDVDVPVPRREGIASSRPRRRATCPILRASIRIFESQLHPITFSTLPRKPALSTVPSVETIRP